MERVGNKAEDIFEQIKTKIEAKYTGFLEFLNRHPYLTKGKIKGTFKIEEPVTDTTLFSVSLSFGFERKD
jgi:hypothetical protein